MLSPKPNRSIEKKGWKDLDQKLQMNFKSKTSRDPDYWITVADYEMTANEIKTEAERQGYKVTLLQNDEIIKFE